MNLFHEIFFYLVVGKEMEIVRNKKETTIQEGM